MKRALLALAIMLAGQAGAQDQLVSRWNDQTLGQLKAWARSAPDDALPAPDLSAIDRAQAAGDFAARDRAANDTALALARLHLLGSTPPAQRKGWRIADSDGAIDLGARLSAALAAGKVDGFFAGLQPLHPDYARLRGVYLTEKDSAKRLVLARNMERWRWLPQSLGEDYLLVNAAAFEARLWRKGEQAGAWRVIVGKTSTPTPVFAATVTGVNINPWWEVPGNIVRESVGGLIRRSPTLARQRGYIWGGGRVRQKPGPTNALGQMKLVMPNPYSVYLHDTPNRDLFGRDVRAFSHGCVRVGNALDLAATLLSGVKTRAQVDALVAAGNTVTVNLARPVPVYITYFTAGTRGDGSFGYFEDIYGRDNGVRIAPALAAPCDG